MSCEEFLRIKTGESNPPAGLGRILYWLHGRTCTRCKQFDSNMENLDEQLTKFKSYADSSDFDEDDTLGSISEEAGSRIREKMLAEKRAKDSGTSEQS